MKAEKMVKRQKHKMKWIMIVMAGAFV